MFTPQDAMTVGAGAVVGAVLGLVGGGGSILAVPLLIYGAGVSPPHVAIGTSALAVAASALANLMAHTRAGNVRWPCALVFSAAGIAGAWLGSTLAKQVDGKHLVALFGGLMLVVGAMMLRPRPAGRGTQVRLSWTSAPRMLPSLAVTGGSVGMLSGFFGIGGGFLIVPGLMFATGMPLLSAIGTSLVAVAAFGATTAINYAASGLVDWRIAAIFLAGGVLGGLGGVALGRMLAQREVVLRVTFAAVVIAAGLYVIIRSL